MALEGASTETADEAALAGMVTALDPNSAYLDRRALQLLEEDQTGEVEGIGALVASEDLTCGRSRVDTLCGRIGDVPAGRDLDLCQRTGRPGRHRTRRRIRGRGLRVHRRLERRRGDGDRQG